MFVKLAVLWSLIMGLCGMSWATLGGIAPATPTAALQTVSPWRFICGTALPGNDYPEKIAAYNVSMADYAATLNAKLTLESLRLLHVSAGESSWGCYPTTPSSFRIVSTSWYLDAATHDTILIGGIIRQILAIHAADANFIREEWVNWVSIRISTTTLIYEWYFSYEQAQTAITDGISDQELWELGAGFGIRAY